MQRILLILESISNRNSLAKLLAKNYEVLLYENEESLRQKFDLCLTEGFPFKKIKAQVRQLRAELEPVFLPFVLVTSDPRVSLLTDDLQNTVDEVILTPIKKKELLVRVKSLLRARHLSLQLEAQNIKLIELTLLKNRFISIAAHDLRNPLGVVSGSIQLLETYGDKLTPEKKEEVLSRMKTSIKNMNSLLEDTLILNKAEEGKLELNPSLINLNEFCQNLTADFKVIYSDRHLNFVNTSSLENRKPLPMDGKVLRHILGNLLSNALKYSTQKAAVKFELNCQSDAANFIIEDQGIGIPQEKLGKLFEPFNRANNVGAISGSGLGLSIVKECVDLCGGNIEVKSEVGVGTTFIVQLPIANL